MKLTTKITIQKIRIIADYQRKENNPMFAAILQYALENDAIITVEEARRDLSGMGLNKRMWENILRRLKEQEYFTESERWNRNNEGYYELTEFGKEAANLNTFFKSMKGELEVWRIKDAIDWLPYQIVKIVEVKSSHKELNNSASTESFKLPLKEILNLKTAAFRFVEIEPKCKVLEEEEINLSINALEKYGEIVIKDLECKKHDFSSQRLVNTFLRAKYQLNFQEREQLVRVSFDKNIQFKRDVFIKEPTIKKVVFLPITLKNISFMAKTVQDAKTWRLEWMKANIWDYIFENDEFEKKSYQIWKTFEPYFKLSLLTVSDYETYLNQNKNVNFYALMYLQAPQFLTY